MDRHFIALIFNFFLYELSSNTHSFLLFPFFSRSYAKRLNSATPVAGNGSAGEFFPHFALTFFAWTNKFVHATHQALTKKLCKAFLPKIHYNQN